ncbi:hypothetical protein NPIL_127601, partial [Nephila pilipes]
EPEDESPEVSEEEPIKRSQIKTTKEPLGHPVKSTTKVSEDPEEEPIEHPLIDATTQNNNLNLVPKQEEEPEDESPEVSEEEPIKRSQIKTTKEPLGHPVKSTTKVSEDPEEEPIEHPLIDATTQNNNLNLVPKQEGTEENHTGHFENIEEK